MTNRTTAEVARLYGISPRRILAIAKARAIPGGTVGPLRVWSENDVAALKPGATGRPKS